MNPSIPLGTEAYEPDRLVWAKSALLSLVKTGPLNGLTVLGLLSQHAPSQVSGNESNVARSEFPVERRDDMLYEQISLTVGINERGGQKEANVLPLAHFVDDGLLRPLRVWR